jgi:hypothetical protein
VLALLVRTLDARADVVDRAAAAPSFVDTFATRPLDKSLWRHWWGDVATGGRVAVLASRSPARQSETFSALVTTRRSWRDFRFDVSMRPARQLRLNDPGNTWETGWVFFRFRDLENYYYFILKPNGWELGKKHGSDAQIFLATGETPGLAIGEEATIRVIADEARIRVAVDGSQILDYRDSRPLGSGTIGLYEEDARVRFGPVRIRPR